MRIAAIGVLKNSGDASSVPTLLEIAVDADEEVAGAARAALAEMADKEIDAQIVERLANAQGKTRLILIVLAGQRQVDSHALVAAVPSMTPTPRFAPPR